MKIIDLSLSIDNRMPGVNITVAKQLEADGWNATTLNFYSHCGTHMDAPGHFLPDGARLHEQDLSVCVGPATVVDLAPAKPKQLMQVSDLGDLKNTIQPHARLLFRTDWHKRYGTPEYRDELPRVSMELAEWLVEKQVAMIGVEPPSVADVNNLQEVTEIHQTLFRGNVLIVEGLVNLDQITQDVVEFIALPLKIVSGDGSPVRAIAIERGGPPDEDLNDVAGEEPGGQSGVPVIKPRGGPRLSAKAKAKQRIKKKRKSRVPVR